MRQDRFLAVLLLVTLLAPLFYPFTVQAAFNQEINYQGKLTDDAGDVVADDDYGFYFRLYTVPTGGSEIWEEDRDTDSGDHVAVTDGLFSVMLGEVESLAGVDFNQTLYLGVEVCGAGGGSCDGEMTPRKILGAVPAAFEADKLDGLTSTQFVRTDTSSTIATTSADTVLTINQTGAGDVLDLAVSGVSAFKVDNDGNITIRDTSNGGVIYSDASPYIHSSGVFNFFAGANAGGEVGDITGNSNVGVGPNALLSLVDGDDNYALGVQALQNSVSGDRNTAIGSNALLSLVVGNDNLAIGNEAGANLAIGTNSGNTIIGSFAGQYTPGIFGISSSTLLGTYANFGADNITNATAIGAGAIVSRSNSLVLGGTGLFDTNVGIGTTSPYAKLSVAGEVVASYFTATSTTAASVLAGSLTVGPTNSAVSLGAGEILATTLKFNASSSVYADEENLILADATVGAKTLSELLVGALTCAQSDAVISGGVVTYSGTGFVFDVSPTTYCINGLQYSTEASQVTLDDADPSLDRIDVIVVNTSEAVDSVTGTPGQNPSAPSVDPDTQLSLTIVFVGAGSTQPGPNEDGPAQELIYLENTEWTGSQTTPTGEVSFSDATNPQQGATHVEVTTPLAAGDFFQFASSTATWNPTGFITLSFYIKVKTAFVANNNRLVLTFRNNAGAQVGTAVTVQHNTFGFDRTNTSAYQKIAIPLSNFGSVGTAIKYLRFTTQGSNPIDFRIDNIVAEGSTQGTATNFTLGSVIFAGTSGVLSEDHDYFFWDATNNRLGIGTTSPYAALSVAGEIVGANFTSTTTATSTFAGILSVGTSSPFSNPLFVVGTSTPALFVSNGNGKVGIHTTNQSFTLSGTSAFGAALTVRNGVNGFSNLFNMRLESYGGSNFILPTRANGSQAVPTVVNEDQSVFSIFPVAYDGTDYEQLAGLDFATDNSNGAETGDGDMPGRIVFSTTPDGSNSPLERMRIDNQGRVGINTSGTALDQLTMLTVNGTTTDNAGFGLKIRDSSDTDLFTVRNDGVASLGHSLLDADPLAGNFIFTIGPGGAGTPNYSLRLDADDSMVPSIYGTAAGAGQTIIGGGQSLFTIDATGYDGDQYVTAGSITIASDSNLNRTPGDDDMPSRMSFSVTGDGSDSATELMTIFGTGGGNVEIGGASPQWDTTLTISATTSDSSGFALKAMDSSANTLFAIRNDGSVGIGTTSPAATFSLAGSIFASSTGATSTFQGTGINLISAAGHVPCFAINGSCLTGTVSGGFAGMLSSWATSNSLVATSGPTASHFVATSSTATSTFVGKLTVGTSTASNHPTTTMTIVGGILALESGLSSVGISSQQYDGSLFTGYRRHGGQVLGVGKDSRINWTIGTSYGDCVGSYPTCSSFMIALSTTTDSDYVATSSLLQENALFSMDQNGRVGISTGTPAARLGVYVPGSGSSFLRLSSSTNYSVMLVDNDGSLGLSTSTPWKRLSVAGGGVAFSGLSNESGSDNTLCIDPNNFEITNGGATCAASSLRFKENIEDLSYGLEDVLALRPVSYEYIESERPGDDNRYLGFIAEEMLDVIPEVVEFDDEGLPGGIDYAKLTSVLAKAIQELYQSLQNLTGETITYITATFDSLTAGEVKTDKLCVGTVCVTEDEFLAIVQNANVEPATPTPDPVITPDPAATTTSTSTDPEPEEPEETATTTDSAPEPEEIEPEEPEIVDEPAPEPEDPAPEPELDPEPFTEPAP